MERTGGRGEHAREEETGLRATARRSVRASESEARRTGFFSVGESGGGSRERQ
jgi:hypothetical protein